MTDLDAELQRLNEEVARALGARQAWMDDNMVHYAKYKVGEDLYDLDSGRWLGKVSGLYRFWGDGRNPLYDTSMTINYHLKVGDLTYDNTSRMTCRYGNAEEYGKDLDRRKAALAQTKSRSD